MTQPTKMSNEEIDDSLEIADTEIAMAIGSGYMHSPTDPITMRLSAAMLFWLETFYGIDNHALAKALVVLKTKDEPHYDDGSDPSVQNLDSPRVLGPSRKNPKA